MQVSAYLDQPDGQPVPVHLARSDFDQDDLTSGAELPLDAVGGVYRTPGGSSFLEERTGVSLHALISAGVGVDPANVTSVDAAVPGQSGTGRLSGLSSDLVAPSDDGFPFEASAQPALIYDGNNLLFAVGTRTVAPSDPPVMNGIYLQPASGRVLTLTLHLKSTLQYPQATADPASTTVGQTVQLHGAVESVDPTQPLTWTWQVGTQPLGSGPDPTYRFDTAGRFQVTGTVSAPDGSSGSASVSVEVADPSAPPPATPPTQVGGGTGGSNAPNVGPRQGNGADVGGVPTARGGTGAPGRSYDPRPSGAAASATASDGAARADGGVVGYVLSDPTSAVQAVQGAARPRDDSAAALRSGVDPRSLPGWLLAAAAVVVLAALGAVSERRRPATHRTRARPRRKR